MCDCVNRFACMIKQKNLNIESITMRFFLKAKILKIFRTQRAFARACGKSDDWISRIVVGYSDPSEDEMKLIAEKLKVDYLKHPEDFKILFVKV